MEYTNEVKLASDSIERTLPAAEREEADRKEKAKIQKRISDRMGKVYLCPLHLSFYLNKKCVCVECVCIEYVFY